MAMWKKMAAVPIQMRYLVSLSKGCNRAGLEPATTRLSSYLPGLGKFSPTITNTNYE
jgi:hypothetical protein